MDKISELSSLKVAYLGPRGSYSHQVRKIPFPIYLEIVRKVSNASHNVLKIFKNVLIIRDIGCTPIRQF
jgi:hypothetical protein